MIEWEFANYKLEDLLARLNGIIARERKTLQPVHLEIHPDDGGGFTAILRMQELSKSAA